LSARGEIALSLLDSAANNTRYTRYFRPLIAATHPNGHNGNYTIHDSLSTLFALLSDALPRCRAGYLERADKGGFILTGSNGSGYKFLKSVPAATVGALPDAGGSK